MTEQTDRSDPDAQSTLPSEPPDDNYQWTAEEEDPDAAGMPAEFANAPGNGVPGVRSEDTDPPPPPSGEQVE